jgi:hypothetical protein
MYVVIRMASLSVMNMMSLCHHVMLPPIGAKEASNLHMEAIWQLFIPQLQVNKKLWYPFSCTFGY